MGLPKSIRLEGPLANRVPADADSAQIADAMVALWEDIDTAMSPVIGHSGVVALYRRSLHMVATGHPWLAALRVTQPPAMDLPAMRVVLVGQCAADAAAAATALSTTLHGLLVSLIGEALTHRLLLPVWANTLRGSSAPETTP